MAGWAALGIAVFVSLAALGIIWLIDKVRFRKSRGVQKVKTTIVGDDNE